MFIQAANYHIGRVRAINKAVVHMAQTPEALMAAEAVASWFSRPDPIEDIRAKRRKGSAHRVVDADSDVECVKEEDTAWGAAFANADGLHIELCGMAGQSAEEWQDDYSQAVLRRAADIVRVWCDKYGIPKRKLTPEEVASGEAGICGHVDVATAFPEGNDGHTDPGEHFPWGQFLALVKGDWLMALSDSEQKDLYQKVTQLHRWLGGKFLFENPSIPDKDLDVAWAVLRMNGVVVEAEKKGTLP